jgi:NAD(P)-dependent dehydrogenase (short-subunit alcohol dehydrogenase family)
MGDQRVAIVSGAAQGLGAAFMVALRNEGFTVVGFDVLPGADRIADVGDADQVRALVDDVVEHHGRIDVCVNNAGVCRVSGPLDNWDKALDDYDTLFATNTRGVFLLGRAVAPVMAQQGSGLIVNIATDHVLPPPGRPTGGGAHMDVYDASKWALRGFTEAWARTLAPNGVRVVSLCMGATDTPMIRSFLGSRLTAEMEASWMQPEQIAGLVVQLLSSEHTGVEIGAWVGHPVELPPVGELRTRSRDDMAGLS